MKVTSIQNNYSALFKVDVKEISIAAFYQTTERLWLDNKNWSSWLPSDVATIHKVGLYKNNLTECIK